MQTDYKEMKKAIKQVQYDKDKFAGNLIWCVIAGCIAGAISKNVIVGIVVFFVFGILAARKYYEL